MNKDIGEGLRFLGLRCRDKVTGFQGEVTALCCYLYDGNRAEIEGMASDGRPRTKWVDVCRLDVITTEEQEEKTA